MFTYKRSDRELLVYLIGNASTNGGDASRVGIEKGVKYERYYC